MMLFLRARFWSLLFFDAPFLSFRSEEVAQVGEVLLDDEANTLRGERVAREVAIVVLIVEADGQATRRREEIADIEVADEGGVVRRRVVTITKLTIDQQAVVEQPSIEQSLILRIVETLVARRDIGAKLQLSLRTTFDSTELICCESVPESKLCIASEVWLCACCSWSALLAPCV